MSSTLSSPSNDIQSSSASDEQKTLAVLYDQHSAVVLGFLQKLAGDKDQAEELLQAVFLALPAQLHSFDPAKGRFVTWLLKLARTIAGQGKENTDSGIDQKNVMINYPIRNDAGNVHSPKTGTSPAGNDSRTLKIDKEISPDLMQTRTDGVVELLYVRGYTIAQAAAELGMNESAIQLLVRTELKKYRRT